MIDSFLRQRFSIYHNGGVHKIADRGIIQLQTPGGAKGWSGGWFSLSLHICNDNFSTMHESIKLVGYKLSYILHGI